MMPVTSAIAAILAILIFRYSRNIPDEVLQSAAALGGIGCLLLSLICAPWIVKLPIVLLLLLPTRVSQSVNPPSCPSMGATQSRHSGSDGRRIPHYSLLSK